MKLSKLILAAPTVFFLQACSDSSDYNFASSIANDQKVVVALGQTQGLPFPNSLLFRDSEDGTLNIPLDDGVDPTDTSNPTVALNALDGFSTTESMSTTLASAIDPTSVVLGSTVRIFEVTADPATKVVTSVVAELGPTDVAVTVVAGSTIVVLPVRPLKESTHYMGIVTNGVTTTDGEPSEANELFDLISSGTVLRGQAGPLEPLRQFTYPQIIAARSQDIPADTIIQSWSMQTQSITPVLQAVKDQTVAGAITIAPTGFTTQQINPLLGGAADVLIGTLDLPYFQTAPADPTDATGITSNWTGQGGSNLTVFNPTPVVTSTQTVPVLMSVPNAASGQTMPEAGWPVSIFVHGITRDRTDMLAIADSMAAAGFAVIAIDQPMHGITDPTVALSATASPFPADVERTFDIDLVNNATGAPGPDGNVDASGTHFYSPRYLLTSRDNLRQSAADLLVLSASIASIEPTVVPVDAANKTLVGHSLGGTVSTTFLAFDDSIKAATLGMPAAGLARMLIASPAFGPTLIAGLAAAGINQGTADFEQFLTAAQTVIDSGDAINHGAAAAANTAIHLIEVVGDGGASLPDQTVPNNVPTAPLAGTDPLARTMGFDPANPVTATFAGSGLVRFTAGDHGSLLSPAASAAATVEMQRQMATFAATFGTQLVITDTSVVQQ